MSDLPPFFTVEEAAGVVRIGRTLAYQLAARFEGGTAFQRQPGRGVAEVVQANTCGEPS